jgi:hypothetical protein
MSRVLRRGSEALRMPKDGIRAITMMPLTVAPSVSPSEFLSLISAPCEAPLFFLTKNLQEGRLGPLLLRRFQLERLEDQPIFGIWRLARFAALIHTASVHWPGSSRGVDSDHVSPVFTSCSLVLAFFDARSMSSDGVCESDPWPGKSRSIFFVLSTSMECT